VRGLGRSLRVRLAALGLLAIYLPVLLLFGVVLATDTEVTSGGRNDETLETVSMSGRPLAALLALGPVAAALAWWWAGRAVRPLERVRSVAEDIEASDLGRRIGLRHGPAEVIALAASFDSMLDRLEAAAETQRRLIEETSHELRLPLAVLMTNADVVLAHPAPDEAVYRQALERSRAVTERLQQILDELLVDARGRARTMSRAPTDLAAVVRKLAADAEVLAAKKRVAVSVRAPERVVGRVDEPTVARAVANLLDNAVRHAPPGSAVEVRVEQSDSTVSVVVADHGPGLPPEQQRQIFERFWHADDRPGHGLGLPIASQIARAHGGDVSVVSPGPDGDGAVFRLTVRR
jgi:signal transduction histidine kinase